MFNLDDLVAHIEDEDDMDDGKELYVLWDNRQRFVTINRFK